MKVIYSLALMAGTVAALAGCEPGSRAEAEGTASPRQQNKQVAKSPLKKMVADASKETAVKIPSVAENDDRIAASFKKSYIHTAYLKNESIAIRSKDGAVILSGNVEDENQKALASRVAEALPGVKSVDNRIKAKKTLADNSDELIRSMVLAQFFFHRNVSADHTDVSVVDGIVTLRGEALNEAQRELAASYASDVQGVKDVKNEMTVATAPAEAESNQSIGEVIDDASITAQIRMSLLFHRSTSALKTSVETLNGVVTVGGLAKNDAERDLVSKLVTDIKGVKSIVNNMSIEKITSKSD